MKTDVIVLGAGIIGLGAALNLQAKGRSVTLIDRGEPGRETSFGNAGIIERASIYPYAFPRAVGDLLRYALNGTPEAYYHLNALPRVANFLARYWWHSAPSRHAIARDGALPLIENSLSEHEKLIKEAGAHNLLKRLGWIKLFRNEDKFRQAINDVDELRAHGLTFELLDADALAAREPDLKERFMGGIHYRDPANISDPGALSQAYADLFTRKGGVFLHGDARTLSEGPEGWTVQTEKGLVTARDVVIALGPWGQDLAEAFGYKLPMAVKRGYHMHYKPAGHAVLHHTLLDTDNGYVLAPMDKGVRLTTGAEFAMRDAPPTDVPLSRTEPHAKKMFPLAERLDEKPWMGSRPCTPDMLPIIGPAPRHKGLWFNFGHAHHGLTHAAVGGRLLAEMMTGEKPFADPKPYAVTRF